MHSMYVPFGILTGSELVYPHILLIFFRKTSKLVAYLFHFAVLYSSGDVDALVPQNSQVLEGFEIKGGVERDGVYFVIKGERAKEAETEVKKWLEEIKVIH